MHNKTDTEIERVLLLNIGNSITQFALYEDGQLKQPQSFETKHWTAASGKLPSEIAAHRDWPCLVASVVPCATRRLQQYYRSGDLLFISPRTVPQIDFSHVDPSTIGADRIANAAAVVDRNLTPAIIVDCGTAVTLEVINAKKQFLGGAILPGRALQRRALHRHTAQLPDIPLATAIINPPGHTTETAILFGIDTGLLHAISGLIQDTLDALADEMPPDKVQILGTGGDFDFFCRNLPELQPAPDFLTLRGLAAIADSGTPAAPRIRQSAE